MMGCGRLRDFPLMLKKLGSWIGSFKNYFNEIQNDIVDVEDSIDDSLIDWGIYYEKEPMDYECPEHTQQEE